MDTTHDRSLTNAQPVLPTIRIPSDRELDARERSTLVQEFRSEYLRLNPGTNDLVLNRAIEDFRKQVIQASPSLKAFDATMAARQAERQAAIDEQERRRAAEAKGRAEAEIEAERQALLTNWKANGGTEAEFADRWPEMRLRLIEERTLAAQQAKRARAANTWHG